MAGNETRGPQLPLSLHFHLTLWYHWQQKSLNHIPLKALLGSSMRSGEGGSTECLSWRRTWDSSGFKPPYPSFSGAQVWGSPARALPTPAQPLPGRDSLQTVAGAPSTSLPHAWGRGRNKGLDKKGSISETLEPWGSWIFLFSPLVGGRVECAKCKFCKIECIKYLLFLVSLPGESHIA